MEIHVHVYAHVRKGEKGEGGGREGGGREGGRKVLEYSCGYCVCVSLTRCSEIQPGVVDSMECSSRPPNTSRYRYVHVLYMYMYKHSIHNVHVHVRVCLDML